MSDRIFQAVYWTYILVGLLLTAAVMVLGLWVINERPKEVDVKVLLTVILALFTGITWISGAVRARSARRENARTLAINSANFTLQVDNEFNSDRVLLNRHGAVRFLADQRNVPINCEYDISPYRTDPSNLWYGLPSDLIDLFNYFDWLGYLTSERSNAIDQEVVGQRLGPWIINYYDMCRAEIDVFRENNPDRWLYLASLYEDLIEGRKKWYAAHIEPLPRLDDEELNAFLQGEHVRSHRALHSRFIQTTNLNPPAHWHGNADDNIEGD
jgi:hypothetical protein